MSLLSRDGGLKWWRPKWGIQFLWFADVPTEVVSCNIWFILIEISFPVQWCAFKWILNPWILLISYTLLIIYARIGLTPLYNMLVLFVDCWESKLLTQARLEMLNKDLHQPCGIRYVSISFSVRCFISLAYWEAIDFCGYSVYCGTPQAIGSFLYNRIGDHTGDVPCFSLGLGA